MKKTFTILLTILMLFCANAYAETTDAADTSVTRITFNETTTAYEGEWLTFDNDGFMLYIPGDWIDVDPTDEMLEAGTYYAGTTADGAFAMTVSYSADNDVTTNDELAAQLTAAGYTGVTQVSVNGIDVVGYDITAQDVTGMAFLDGEGSLYVFSFTPASDETYQSVCRTIISSLSPITADSDTAE